MTINGDGPRNHPALKNLNLGPLGVAAPSSVIATKTLLFATEGDGITPRTIPNSGGKKFKALDKTTGNVLWETELEAGANGAPMTYLFNGKQYVVVAIGGQNHRAELVALALP
jgi:quinoprotein glucose dehydrogenase